MTAGFRRLYGSNPWHLGGHLVVFFIAAFAITQILGGGAIVNWIAWFVGAALLHDLVLLPLYSGVDRLLGRAVGGAPRASRAPRAASRAPSRGALRNHLRVPLAISGILLIVYFPVILGFSSDNYLKDTGHHLRGYTRNWLLITAGLFLASAIVYAARNRPRRPPAAARNRPRRPPAPVKPRERRDA